MYSRYRLIPHIEVEMTPLFNDDDLRYVISKQHGGNGRKFKQVMVPADCSDSIEMEILLGMGNLAASLDPEHKFLRETVLEHFISTGGLDKYVNPDELWILLLMFKLRPMIKPENLIVT